MFKIFFNSNCQSCCFIHAAPPNKKILFNILMV
nr:MAG TPA: hypothetical protein [Caudoviricetes sp.]